MRQATRQVAQKSKAWPPSEELDAASIYLERNQGRDAMRKSSPMTFTER
jgi:hypothetical protein